VVLDFKTVECDMCVLGVRLHSLECWRLAESREKEAWLRSWDIDWETHSRRKHCASWDHMSTAAAGITIEILTGAEVNTEVV